MKSTFHRVAVLAALLLAVCVGFEACARPKFETPQGQSAYTADQIVLRVNELQAATIQAEASGGVPRNTARTIIEFTTTADRTLAALPSG